MKKSKKTMGSAIQKRFLKNGGCACPYCGEEISIEGEGVEVVHGGAVQRLSCNECGKFWDAIYRLEKFSRPAKA